MFYNLFALQHLLTGELLLRKLLLRRILVLTLGHNLVLFAQHNLDVTWARHVWVDTTMGTVCSSAHLWSTVDLIKHKRVVIETIKTNLINKSQTYHDVLNNKTINIESLEVSIALGISEKLKQKLSTLLGPSTLGGAEGLTLSFATNATVKTTERNDFLLANHVLKVTLSAAERHSLDCLSSLAGVFEVHTQITSTCFARLCWILGFCLVASHRWFR